MDETNSLLPDNAGPATRALELSRFAGLADEVARSSNPEAIAIERLPWLAWGLSVDAWSDAWPEDVRRSVARGALRYHQAKGTIAGLRNAARLTGGQIVQVVDPSSRTFAAPSLTADEREAFLLRYPELRVFKFRSGSAIGFGLAPGYKAFASDSAVEPGSRVLRFPVNLGATARYGDQSFVVRDGVETPLRTVTRYSEALSSLAVDYVEARVPGAARGLFAGALRGRPYAVAHGAARRIYRVRVAQRYEAWADRIAFTTVKPGLDTLGYEAQPVAQRGQRRGTHAGGSFASRAYSVPSGAEARLYSSLRLFNPALPLERRGRSTHLGGARLGMPAYTAEITLRMRGKRVLATQSRFVFGAFVARDPAPLDDALRALSWAQSARDRVLVSTRTVIPARAGSHLIAGTLLAGSLQEAI